MRHCVISSFRLRYHLCIKVKPTKFGLHAKNCSHFFPNHFLKLFLSRIARQRRHQSLTYTSGNEAPRTMGIALFSLFSLTGSGVDSDKKGTSLYVPGVVLCCVYNHYRLASRKAESRFNIRSKVLYPGSITCLRLIPRNRE